MHFLSVGVNEDTNSQYGQAKCDQNIHPNVRGNNRVAIFRPFEEIHREKGLNLRLPMT